MSLKLVDLFAFFSVILRAGILVFQSLVLGGAVFLVSVGTRSSNVSLECTARIQKSSWRLLRLSAIALAAAQFFYLYVNSTVLMATAEIGMADIVGANFFIAGSVILIAALLMAFISTSKKYAHWELATLAVAIIGASVMTNHAASRLAGRAFLVTLSLLHELAVGFWIGGLPFLMLALRSAKDLEARYCLAKRFSRLALLSVAVLVLSGAVMSVLYVQSWQGVFGTTYGVMVSAKVAMLAALLVLGGVNYRLLRKSPNEKVLARLRRLIEAEAGIGLTVILTAASLTSQTPAVDQLDQAVTFQRIFERLKPKLPRLKYEYVAEAGSTRREPNTKTPVAVPSHARDVNGVLLSAYQINNAIESESNHHWMGLVVLAMGLLALLARTGTTWAEYWPLLLIGITLFIFIQADTECWPAGPQGFWACWAHPEDFQHRIAGLVCVGFAIFEARVRRRCKTDDPLALVFPLMCAVGGAVLLTHSHAISNVKENLLVELNHIPMGILAVFAGWTRWLELRLPEGDRGIPSWIWPACFVLIGMGLLNYREM
jgi:putative copper resistance protein D